MCWIRLDLVPCEYPRFKSLTRSYRLIQLIQFIVPNLIRSTHSECGQCGRSRYTGFRKGFAALIKIEKGEFRGSHLLDYRDLEGLGVRIMVYEKKCMVSISILGVDGRCSRWMSIAFVSIRLDQTQVSVGMLRRAGQGSQDERVDSVEKMRV